MSRLPTLLLGLALAGCEDPPLTRDAQTYPSAMTPLLSQNKEIARTFLDMAGAIKKRTLEPAAISKRLEGEILPMAEKLKADAAAVDPEDPQLAAAHDQLVAAWGARVALYQEIDAAWKSGEVPRLDAAIGETFANKRAELVAIGRINRVLEPVGVLLDPYELLTSAPVQATPR